MLNDTMEFGLLRWAALGLVCTAGSMALTKPGLAQNVITPDATLGAEASQVVPFAPLPTIDLIQGGAVRGQNLFHSFEEFNIGEGNGAYFIAPSADIANIFARVTGTDASTLLGILGTRQELGPNNFVQTPANLFLINPNGIIFGTGSGLDIGGSFYATTADSIQFGDAGVFSALEPESDNLLSINPSAFWFSGLSQPSNIEVRGSLPTNFVTLQVPNEKILALIGGDISFDGGRLVAPGGRVEIVALAEGGGVELSSSESSLIVPETISRANVALINASSIDTTSGGGGDISVVANNLTISNFSRISSGIGFGLGVGDSQTGNISVDVTEAVTLADNSFIQNVVVGLGQGGDINITAQDVSIINGSGIATAGFGEGDVGNVTIEVSGNISLTGRGANNQGSGILSSVARNVPGFENLPGQGDSGNINLRAINIELADGAIISSSSVLAPGNSGNIDIIADNLSLIEGSQLVSSTLGIGNSGNLTISTRLLNVQDGSSIQTSTSGQGQGGNLTITAREATSLIGSGTFASGVGSSALSTETTGSGNAGRLRLETGQLTLQDGATISASTFGGSGSAGSLDIFADSIQLTGIRADRQFSSTIQSISSISPSFVQSTGNAGNISINTRLLTVQDGGSIRTATFGPGQGGNLTITAREATNLVGSGTLAAGVESRALSTQTTGSGNAGRLRVETGQLTLQDGATISASTFGGSGSAGSLDIFADSIRLSGLRADRQFSSTIQSISSISPSFGVST